MMIAAQTSFGASVSQSDIEKAQAQRARLQAELDASVVAYEAAESKLDRTRSLISASRLSLEESQERIGAAQARIGIRANLVYREGSVNVFEFLFTSRTWDDFNRRLKLIGKVSKDDRTRINEIEEARSKTESVQRQLAQRLGSERRLMHEMAAKSESLSAKFAQAVLLEKKLVADRRSQAELTRQAKAKAISPSASPSASPATAKALEPTSGNRVSAAAIPTPTATPDSRAASPEAARTSGGIRCPVHGPTSFTDTYGHPREGGRRHEGVDMFSANGVPVVATTAGVIHRQGSGGAGGISVTLRGSNGTDYYYAHLSGFSSISKGQKVAAGTRLGYVGSTGNASATAPHLHFEIRPGGGGPINPYPAAKAACS